MSLGTASLQAVLDKSRPLSDNALRLIDDDVLQKELGLPKAVLQALKAVPALNQRLLQRLCEKLGLTGQDEVKACEVLPDNKAKMMQIIGAFGLTLALQSHKGVFDKQEYDDLLRNFGPDMVGFAFKQRGMLRDMVDVPNFEISLKSVVQYGVPTFINALSAAKHPASTLIAIAFQHPIQRDPLPEEALQKLALCALETALKRSQPNPAPQASPALQTAPSP
jgi:hypothetical protein